MGKRIDIANHEVVNSNTYEGVAVQLSRDQGGQ